MDFRFPEAELNIVAALGVVVGGFLLSLGGGWLFIYFMYRRQPIDPQQTREKYGPIEDKTTEQYRKETEEVSGFSKVTPSKHRRRTGAEKAMSIYSNDT